MCSRRSRTISWLRPIAGTDAVIAIVLLAAPGASLAHFPPGVAYDV